jgi:hypothetical protein
VTPEQVTHDPVLVEGAAEPLDADNSRQVVAGGKPRVAVGSSSSSSSTYQSIDSLTRVPK